MGLVEKVLNTIGDALSVSPTVAAIILAVALAIIVLLVIFIVKAAIKSKKDSRAMSPARPEEIAISIAPVIKDEQTNNDGEQIKDKEIEKPQTEKLSTAKTLLKSKTTPATIKKALYGKWVIEHKSDDEYLSKLLASNGEVMLTSEIYKSEDGAEAGISSICRGVENGKFVIYQDKNKNYFYKLKTAGNRLLCVGEIYKSKDQCLKAVETVKRIANGSPIAEDVLTGKEYVKYTPQPLGEAKKAAKGKWKIEKNENGEFSAKLYANNGQLMLATEEVVSKKSAENAVEAVKKNSAAGNFIIDRDKFGRYYYKLRNAQKSVVCIGESYESLDSCLSAIESVRRFAANSELPISQ